MNPAAQSESNIHAVAVTASAPPHTYIFIKSIAGLKVIALLLLYWWHSPFTNPSVDLGARTCEILFVCSGFLVAYNYRNRDVPATWEQSWKSVAKKLAAFWPLHVLCMLLTVFSSNMKPEPTQSVIGASFLNLSLLQSWAATQKNGLAFNGASWFLSALLFCYFVTPQFLPVLKKKRLPVLLFLMTFAARYALEYALKAYPGQFWSFNVHNFAVVRCLEYLMGFFMAPLFISAQNRLSQQQSPLLVSAAFSVLEVVTTVGVVYLTIVRNGIWYRAQFVLLFCGLVFALAFDKGIVSKILSLPPFLWLSKIQFEFFMIHQAVIYRFRAPLHTLIADWNAVAAILLPIILLAAVLYRLFLSKPLTALMKKVLRTLYRKVAV